MQQDSYAQATVKELQKKLQEYKAALDVLRKEHTSQCTMADIELYLFGMGDRKKMI